MKRRISKRDRMAKQLLVEEMRLSQYYRKEDMGVLEADDRANRIKVINAVDRTIEFLTHNYPEQVGFAEAVILHGNANREAVCLRLNISSTTYYNWRDHVLRVFGTYAGINV